MSDTFLVKAYGGLTRLMSPLLPLYLKRRAAKGKEDKSRLKERFGHASRERPEGHLIWLHGASVGETMMLLPLINRILERPNTHILLTSGTVTSADLMAKRLPDRAIHQYVPVDNPAAVKRFLNHWKPDAALWAESEIWPNLIRLTKKRGIPMALINARMSQASLLRWKKHGVKNAQSVFGNFDKILAANSDTAFGLTDLMGREIPNLGNLKYEAPPLPVDDAELQSLQATLKDRLVWCAASTHKGEDEIVLKIHAEIRETFPEALLILIPRHPERSTDIADLMARETLAIRSQNERPDNDKTIYLFDTIGELGLAYRLSKITLMGGSLIEGLSGHNPLEPARLGNVVYSGPYVSSFDDLYRDMKRYFAVQILDTRQELAKRMTHSFYQPASAHRTLRCINHFLEGHTGVLDKVWLEIEPLMPESNS